MTLRTDPSSSPALAAPAGAAPAHGPASLACRAGSVASPVLRALWFIEAHLSEEVCLDDIAAAADLSRFQLSRTFVAVTGVPVMHYVRGRRLSEAARALACGAPDILTVALDWGYGSHEAFTRAFCSRFGITPERLRAQGRLDDVHLTQALIITETRIVDVLPPRLERGRALTIAGLGERYTLHTNKGIPLLWQQFVPCIAQVPHQTGTHTYGVCCNSDSDGCFDYVAGVEVSGVGGLPPAFTSVQLPERQYAVFTHRGHISGIRDTVYSIWNHYLPRSGHRVVAAPDYERYTEAFDPQTGNGDVEIWVPAT